MQAMFIKQYSKLVGKIKLDWSAAKQFIVIYSPNNAGWLVHIGVRAVCSWPPPLSKTAVGSPHRTLMFYIHLLPAKNSFNEICYTETQNCDCLQVYAAMPLLFWQNTVVACGFTGLQFVYDLSQCEDSTVQYNIMSTLKLRKWTQKRKVATLEASDAYQQVFVKKKLILKFI